MGVTNVIFLAHLFRGAFTTVIWNIYIYTYIYIYNHMSFSGNDDVIKWKHFPRNWPFVRGIHRSPLNFPAQKPVTRSFDVFFYLRLNKRLSKQSWGWWFETLSRPLWHHCDVKMLTRLVRKPVYSMKRLYDNMDADGIAQSFANGWVTPSRGAGWGENMK